MPSDESGQTSSDVELGETSDGSAAAKARLESEPEPYPRAKRARKADVESKYANARIAAYPNLVSQVQKMKGDSCVLAHEEGTVHVVARCEALP